MTSLDVDPEAFVGEAITASGTTATAPTRVPAARYRDPAFYTLEMERLWPRVWQIAGSVDHVAEPGDVLEYRVGPYSLLVVRGDDGELRAFQNACRHRGNVICTGGAQGLGELRCGFHNWVYDLRGRLRQVPSRKGFGVLRNEDFSLVPASVGVWGRLVFVNPDPAAEPLADHLEDVPGDIAWVGMDEYRCTHLVTVPVEANWKVVADGFSETYHLQGLHREMLPAVDDVNSGQRLWNRHGVSYQDYAVPSPRLGASVTDQEVWEGFVVSQGARMGVTEVGPMPALGPGQTVRELVAAGIVAHHLARGVDLSRFSTEQLTRLCQYNLFPNATVLVSPDLLTVLVSRPAGAADRAELVIIGFDRVASAAAARTSPVDATVPLSGADFGMVFNQDFALLEHVQIGVRQPGLTHVALSSEECRIINMQRNLERWLAEDPAELPGGAMI